MILCCVYRVYIYCSHMDFVVKMVSCEVIYMFMYVFFLLLGFSMGIIPLSLGYSRPNSIDTPLHAYTWLPHDCMLRHGYCMCWTLFSLFWKPKHGYGIAVLGIFVCWKVGFPIWAYTFHSVSYCLFYFSELNVKDYLYMINLRTIFCFSLF